MNQPDLDLMNRILDGVENSDSWSAALMKDPGVLTAAKAFTDIMNELRATGAPENLIERVDEASAGYVASVTPVAMMYGIHMFRTILYFSEKEGFSVNERDEGGKDVRPVPDRQTADDPGKRAGDNASPKVSPFSLFGVEFLGCLIGSFIGTVLVKIITHFL